MNWIQIEANWDFAKGKVKEMWGDLTDDDVMSIDGKREQLSAKLQNRYGITKQKAEDEIESFLSTFDWRTDPSVYSSGSSSSKPTSYERR